MCKVELGSRVADVFVIYTGLELSLSRVYKLKTVADLRLRRPSKARNNAKVRTRATISK